MTSHAKIAIGLAHLFVMSFPMAEHEGWGRGPSIVIGAAFLAMAALALWRGRGHLRHEENDPLI